MKTKKWMCCMAAVAVMMTSSSCHEWGEMDPPAAGDIYPTLENVAQYTFDDETLDPMLFKTGSYTGVDIPELYADPEKGQVLYLNNGYVTMANPLASVTCQNAVSLTFWMKQGVVETALVDNDAEEADAQDLTGALIGFTNDNESGRMFFTANGWISYTGLDGEWSDNDPAQYKTGYITPGEWHYVALTVRNDGYGIYVDGQRKVDKTVTDFDMSKIVKFMNKVSTLYIGKGSDTDTAPWSIDDLKIYRNQITDKEIQRPNMSGGGNIGSGFEPVAPVYFNSFDAGVSDVTIYGDGEFKYVGGAYGNVFSNVGGARRSNYLIMPENLFTYSAETQAISIGFWVNRGNETNSSDYFYSPLFSAYAERADANSWPMFICQTRGVLQINCAGWSDYSDAQNVNGVNAVLAGDNDWLADGDWHYYMAVITPTTAKVYIDGEIGNEWEIDGTVNTAAGLFSNGADLKYICLGGNQAWDWGDNDPGFWFDDFAVYNQELSQETIRTIIEMKKPVYCNTFSNGAADAVVVGSGSFIDNVTPGFGKVFSNAMNGMRQNYLRLPGDVLSKSADSQELTVSVWVNRGNETESTHYMWSPLFSAYGSESSTDNTFPMFICQYRGLLQTNAGGTWTDYTAAQNLAGSNTEYNGDADWLADGEWHLYTAVITPTTAKVYFDGEIANEWELDGSELGGSAAGLLSSDNGLSWICLGGNQAWNWGDPDPGFWFDDMMIYNRALSQGEIKQLMLIKK